MDLDHIKALIELMAASDLSEMEVSEGGWTLRLSRRAAALPAMPSTAPAPRRAAAVPPPEPNPAPSPDLRAPLSGVIHLQAEPGAPPFVRPGATVAAGATLCLIEAMKVFNTVRAERAGTIAAVLVENGAEVDAGQTLMRIA